MKKLISIFVATIAMAMAFATPLQAKEKVLSQGDLKQLLNNNTGRHWSLDHERWYVFTWQNDGVISVSLPDAEPDDEPVEKGTWRVKEIVAKDDDDPEEIKKQNEELSYLYCQSFENWTSDHELCFEMVQETFDTVGDSEVMAATQEYKCYREAGAETGAFTITRQ